MPTQVVDVKSAWFSKVNWTAALSALLTLLVAFGLPLTEEQKAGVLSAVGVIGPVIVMILKTYFTTTVTPASAAKLP